MASEARPQELSVKACRSLSKLSLTAQLAQLFRSDGPRPLLESLYEMADDVTQLALAHSCKTYMVIHDRHQDQLPLSLKDIQLDARFPDRSSVRKPVVNRSTYEKEKGKLYSTHTWRPATERDLKRTLVRQSEFSFYAFEEYKCPPYIHPLVWSRSPNSYDDYKGIKTPDGCVMLKGRGVSDSMFGRAIVETWRLPYGRTAFTLKDIADIVVGRYCSSRKGPEHLRYSTYWTDLPVSIPVQLNQHLYGPFMLVNEDFEDRPEPDPEHGDVATNPALRVMLSLASGSAIFPMASF